MSARRFHWTPELSDTARRMRDNGAPLRDIGRAVGTGKDVVARHLAALSQAADQPEETPTETLRARVAARNAVAYDALDQLRDAVSLVEQQRLAHLVCGETRARQIETDIRAHADTLLRIANAFTEYYPAPAPRPATHPA
ncbi:hypothetical protein [Streptomyces sp. NPDC093111]|uniref:hypothetical protein n=1 Tax=Streptomyces sp. NPDC093111 TaxID=3154978 RepID=UPI00342802AF